MKKNLNIILSIFLLVLIATLSFIINNKRNVISPKAPKAADSRSSTRGTSGDKIADIIIGQPDFSEGMVRERVANHVFNPGGVFIERSTHPNKVYIADNGNSRILGYKSLGVCSNNSATKCTDDTDCTSPGICNLIPNKNADMVIGQPDFTRGACNGDGGYTNYPAVASATSTSLCLMPQGQNSPLEGGNFISMATDASHNLYVPDAQNNRVLMYKDPLTTGDKIADGVWGQSDFTGNQCNRALSAPANNTLCLGDPSPQSGFTAGVDIDTGGNLWVTDVYNNRVLRFPKCVNTTDPGCTVVGIPSSIANLVLGQTNFSGKDPNPDPSNASIVNRFTQPGAVNVHTNGVVFVVDTYYPHPGQVLGSIDSGRILTFTPTFTNGMNGVFWGDYNNRFRLPTAVEFTLDNNSVWVSDSYNHSVELWNLAGTQVQNILYRNVFQYGQEWTGPGCTSNPSNFSCYQGDSRGSIGLTGHGDLFLSSSSSEQDVVRYKAPIRVAVPGGEVTSFDFRLYPQLNPTYEYLPNYNALTGRSFGSPFGVEAVGNQLIVTDNWRLMYWDNATSIANFSNGTVIGGGGDHGDGRPYGKVHADNASPTKHLYVAHDRQIEIYNLPLTSSSTPIKIIGDNSLPNTTHFTLKDLSNNSVNIFQNFRNTGTDISVEGLYPDPNGKYLWVAHSNSNRVFRIRNPITNPQVDFILGQSNSTNIKCNSDDNVVNTGSKTNLTLCLPSGVTMDKSGNLYISDMGGEDGKDGNRRLVKYKYSDIFSNDITYTGMKYGSSISSSNVTILFNGKGPFEPAFDSSNRMVVGFNPYIYANTNHSIEYYDDISINSSTPSSLFTDYIKYPRSLDFDDSGNLYVADLNRFRVIKYKTPLGTPPTATPAPVVAPANLTFDNTNTLRPRFNWDSVPGATSYNLKIFANTCTGTPLYTKTLIKALPYPLPADLTTIRNKTICWQAQAVFTTGVSSYINGPTFTGANPPNIPTAVVYPLNAATTIVYNSLNPTFQWKAPAATTATATVSSAPVPTKYDFEIKEKTSFAVADTNRVFADSGFAGTSTVAASVQSHLLSSTTLEPNTTYFWRVRSVDNTGQKSYWSSAAGWTFKTGVPSPTGLTISANSNTLRPTFKWNSVAGASKYILKAFTNATGVCTGTAIVTATITTLTTPTVSYIHTADLPATVRTKQVCWQVQAGSVSYGLNPLIPNSKFTGANPPNIPALVAPAVTTTKITGTGLTFKWNMSTITTTAGVATPKGEYYVLQYSTDPNFVNGTITSSPIQGTVNPVTTTANLTPAKYYWRVRAQTTSSGGVISSWSANNRYFFTK